MVSASLNVNICYYPSARLSMNSHLITTRYTEQTTAKYLSEPDNFEKTCNLGSPEMSLTKLMGFYT